MILVVPLIWMVLAQAPATVPLSGTVVGAAGQPVAGADLILAGMPVYDPPILARGRSDAEGRFTFERPAGLKGQDRFIAPMLWVVKPGFHLSLTKFPGPMPMPGAGEPIRVVLKPPGKAEVRVERPNGEPMLGAKVRVEWFGRQSWTNVPDAVADLIEVTTDKDGLAVITAADNEDVAYVDVHSKDFGIQGRPFYPTTSGPKRIWLRPVSSLKGRLIAADPKMVKGWRVWAYARSGDSSTPEPETTGYNFGTTGDDGRFSFPAIAPGNLQLVLKAPGDVPVVADLPRTLAVVEEKENSLEIPLRPAATVAGVVLERDTGEPVPGVNLWLAAPWVTTGVHTETDAQGRYTFKTLARKAQVIVTGTPPSHASAWGTDRKEFTIPEGPGRIDLDPIEIVRAAPPVRFVVRDEEGKPVAGATVRGHSSSRTIMETADARGELGVAGVAPGGEVTIEVQGHERSTDGPVKAIAGGAEPVTVTIVPGLVVAVGGRVLGPDGMPVSGALVRVQLRKENPNSPGRFEFPETVHFVDDVEIRTGPDGTFRSPKELYRKAREFRAEVTAAGFLPGHTGWVAAAERDLVALADVSLRRLQTLRFLSGRVVDREGQGVAGVSVFQSGDAPRRTATTTDAEGRFRLVGVPSAGAFVFTERTGFRFGGAIVGPGEGKVEIGLAREAEPPLAIPRMLPPLLTRAEERALGRELLAPLVVASRSGSLGSVDNSLIPALARVDPDRVLAMLENRVLSDPASVVNQVALAQLEDDPAKAVATVAADLNPATRAEGFLVLADAWPGDDRAHRIELIDRALAEARRVVDSTFAGKVVRLGILGHVADHWLDLDLPDRAMPVLHEGRRIVATLPRDRHISDLEEFAESLAAFDLATARLIFERRGQTNANAIAPQQLNRNRAEAAIRLAAIDPAEAERLVHAVTPESWDPQRPQYLLRICQRMARSDLARARKILDMIDQPIGLESFPSPSLRFEGLARMASELAATNPAGARGLLDEALAGFQKLAHDGDRDGGSCSMAELLPMVESIEPDRLQERLWLTLACRQTLAAQPDSNAVNMRVRLAMLVSRYDRAMAAALIAPALERLGELVVEVGNDSFVFHSSAAAAIISPLVVYDTRAAAALIQALPDSARKVPERKDNWQFSSVDAQLRLAAAQMLGLPVDEQIHRALHGMYQPRLYRRMIRKLK